MEVQTLEPDELVKVSQQIRCLVPQNATNRVRTAKVTEMPQKPPHPDLRESKTDLEQDVDQVDEARGVPNDGTTLNPCGTIREETEEMALNDLDPELKLTFRPGNAPNDPGMKPSWPLLLKPLYACTCLANHSLDEGTGNLVSFVQQYNTERFYVDH